MTTPQFSIVVIGRNEATTLPRLLESTAEFRDRAGDFLYVDTGSTDGTCDVARKAGVRVVECGDRWLTSVEPDLARQINQCFGRRADGGPPIVTPGTQLFDYSAARNYAASDAQCSFVAMPDCDEAYSALDINAVNRCIQDPTTDQLEYDYVYAHDDRGRELTRFRHSKFYRTNRMEWTGVVHEVLKGDSIRKTYLPPTAVKLEHWPQANVNRTRYLAGLAVDCFNNPDDDRKSHYFARELMYRGYLHSAIDEFERHVTLGRWALEKAQSLVFIGDCLARLGGNPEPSYFEAIRRDGTRREPWIRLAEHYLRAKKYPQAAACANAALSLPWVEYYANDVSHYREHPHMILYPALWWMGDRVKSKEHWERACALVPNHPKLQADAVFYRS